MEIFDDNLMDFNLLTESAEQFYNYNLKTMKEVIDYIPEKKKSIDFKYAICKDSNGNIIDHTKYEKMIINGESLDLFGIHHDDIVFIKPMTPKDMNSIQFPKTLVFNKIGTSNNNDSKYIIVRAYKTVNISNNTNLSYYLNEIMNKRDFQSIKNDIRYVSNTYFRDYVLKKQIPKNCFNLTLFARINEDGYWIADFIPSNQFFGLAEYAFHKDDFYIE